MATFLVRVQLGGSPPDSAYRVLHEAMGQSRYRQTIEGSRIVWLPHAQYTKTSNQLTCDLIRDEVKKIVKQTYPGNQFELMVVEIKTWASYGLRAFE